MKLPLLFAFILGIQVVRGAGDVRVVTDVPYLGATAAEKLDLYLPAGVSVPMPAIVWIHGGGWKSGTKSEGRAKEICSTLAGAGYVAASVEYRLGNGAWPENLFDCKNAIRFLRAHATEYHIDPSRVAIAGGSAGGHLALLIGFTPGVSALEPAAPYPDQRDDVRCVIDLYGPADLRVPPPTAPDAAKWVAMRKLMAADTLATFGATSVDAQLMQIASPITYIARSEPPVLIIHGRADTTVDFHQSEMLAQALTARGVEHEFVALPGIGHTFDFENWQKKPLPQDLRPVVLAFLAKNLGAPAAR